MELLEEYEKWKRKHLSAAEDKKIKRKGEFSTTSGINYPVISLPGEIDYLDQIGFPGEYPFTRGIQPTMYRGRLWTMRQYAGYATSEETNRRFQYLLKEGQTGLSVAFDLPTQIGYDADDPLVMGEVGKVGVSISSIQDMETLFRGIKLDKVSTSMTINAPAAILLAMYYAIGMQQNIDGKYLRGTIQNDILKEYIARGTYIFPPAPSMRLVTDVFKFCREQTPNWNTISISGYHIREAGANAVQEVAFTISNAIAYVEAALRSGLDVDEFAGQISFFFNSHNNFLEEIAKFRAARRLWANIMRDRFHASNARSWMMRFHTQTAGSTLTAQQPENNIVRVTLQALAAVMGGTQSLHTNSMDEALGLPTETSVRTALRTQQILAYESGVADTVDPLAGSYIIEYLTEEVSNRIQSYIEKIDQMGGSLKAIENGYIQSEIQNSAYKYQKSVETNEAVIVGVNSFHAEDYSEIQRISFDPMVEKQQRERLLRLRETRDQGRVNELLSHLEKTAKGEENLMPVLIECVRSNITLGEICNSLRRVWGEYHARF